MANIGGGEILLLLLLALLLFGAKRLPEIGRSVGKGMREFKNSVSGGEREDDPLDPNQRAALERHQAKERAATSTPLAGSALEGEIISDDRD